MNISTYVVTFVPDENHMDLSSVDGFNQVMGVCSSFDEAVDCLKAHTEADEVFLDFDLNKNETNYFYTNYGTYKIEKFGMWIPS